MNAATMRVEQHVSRPLGPGEVAVALATAVPELPIRTAAALASGLEKAGYQVTLKHAEGRAA